MGIKLLEVTAPQTRSVWLQSRRKEKKRKKTLCELSSKCPQHYYLFGFFCAGSYSVKDATVGCSMSCFQCVKQSSAAIPGPKCLGIFLNGSYYKWRGLFFYIFQMYLEWCGVVPQLARPRSRGRERYRLAARRHQRSCIFLSKHGKVLDNSKQARPMTPKSVCLFDLKLNRD